MISTAFAALALTLSPAPQTDVIAELFDRAIIVYREHGYAEAGWQQRGDLNEGGEASFAVTLRGGTEYGIIGVCDRDCGDLDLYLTDAAGKPVASDMEDDDYPTLAVPRGGVYRLRVVMKGCRFAPCAFGVKAFMK